MNYYVSLLALLSLVSGIEATITVRNLVNNSPGPVSFILFNPKERWDEATQQLIPSETRFYPEEGAKMYNLEENAVVRSATMDEPPQPPASADQGPATPDQDLPYFLSIIPRVEQTTIVVSPNETLSRITISQDGEIDIIE